MRITLKTAALTLDVDVTVVDPAVQLGEVYQAIIGQTAGPTILVDGWPYRRGEAIGGVPLHSGSIIADTSAASGAVTGSDPTTGSNTAINSGTAPDQSPIAAVLTQVAGHDTGRAVELTPGTYDVGRSDGHASEGIFRIEVGETTPPVVRPLTNNQLWLDDEPAWGEGGREVGAIRTRTEAFRLDQPHGTRPPVLPMADSATIAFHRSPRLLLDEPELQPVKPGEPQKPPPPTPFSWLLALAPIPIGVVVAFLFSPFFLVFALMSPILSGARWFDGKKKSKKATAAYQAERERLVDEYRTSMEHWAAAETARTRAMNPDLRELTDRVTTRVPGLWERRPEHADYLHVVVGLGPVAMDSAETDFSEVQALSDELSVLAAVPITVDLRTRGALGIVGPPDRRRAAADAVTAELAINHGPADLGLILLLAQDRVMEWDWAKWLPHLEDSRGFRSVITDVTQATAVLQRMERPEPTSGSREVRLVNPTPIVVVDGEDYLHGGFTALSAAVRGGAARAIVLADRVEDLPAICTRVLTLGDETELIAMESGKVDRDLIPRLLAPDRKAEMCRGLAAFVDPERLDRSSSLPQNCNLKSLSAVDISAEGLAASWASDRRDPVAVIGVAAHGPLSLNLVTDGPHALLAGTTGSGKSELLRTLVASLAIAHSPEQLNFVLIDFKGGGAFDACESLPHTVGVVTDLDESLAARALRCLKAELKYREHRLRDAGVSDLRDYEPDKQPTCEPNREPAGADGDTSGQPLPRLVVVVDEFATLAAELPDFMASLVDIAQRGRSLGIHMILATQRPAGVVDAKIRANTNLRISLRVQDESDSQDVLGDKKAASIDRRSPGRGYVRLGASDLAEFQAAIVSERTDETVALPLRVTTFDLMNAAPDTSGQRSGSRAEPNDHLPSGRLPTDLEELAMAAQEAVANLDIAPPRIPWPAALPSSIDASELLDRVRPGGWSAPLGVVDLPDEQRTKLYEWSPAVGNLAVYGTDTASTSAVVSSLLVGLAAGHSPDEAHLYIVDFSGGGAFSELQRFNHVGAIVTAQDEERLIRLIDRLDAQLTERGARAREQGLASVGPEDGFPIIMLAIANYGGLMAYLEESNKFELGARFERFVRDGPALGLYVTLTANQERGIPARLAGQIESKLIMRLADPNSYAAFGLRAKEVPDMGHGRAIDIRTGLDVQIAEYPDVSIHAGHSGQGPQPSGPDQIQVLETNVAASGLVEQSSGSRGGLRLAIGRRHSDLMAAMIELQTGTSFVVTGGSGSGKTTALRTIALATQYADQACSLVVVSRNEDEWASERCHQVSPTLSEELIDTERTTLVLVDGIAGFDEEQGKAMEKLIGQPNLWFVLAERPELLMAPPMWFRRFAASRSGLLLRPQNDHGEILRARLPARSPATPEPGRGYLINAGSFELIQVATTET